jgi:NAD(P)-dependent dehydrogenase (short-subunit alcohol dehydrogenase family)
MDSKTFLITGAGSGFGRALTVRALAAGHRVAGTLRDPGQLAAFDALKPGQSTGVLLDVTDMPAIPGVVARLENSVGPIDVLVNNAGYGHEGTVEESPLEELRRQFEVNVFGAVAMIKAVLPYMRARRRGHIINITSMGGLMTMPGLAYYHGSKFALEGISGALHKEVGALGIAVTAVEPGMFRTDWAGRSMIRTERSIPDYDAIFDPIRAARSERNGRQPGDPDKAALAMLELVNAAKPPSHLMLGPDALRYVRAARDSFDAETTEWERIAASTDFAA